MRALTPDEIRPLMFGGVEFEERDGAISTHRFTKEQRQVWDAIDADKARIARCTTGVRLDLHTDASALCFEIGDETPNEYLKFDLLIDGKYQYSLTPVTRESFTVTTDGGEHRITLIFPSHARGWLYSVQITRGASLTPHVYDKKLLMTGDSITQGWNSGIDSLAYAWRVALSLDADLLCHGVGGAVFHDTTYKALAFEPDLITVAYGCNDYSLLQSEAALRTNMAAFLGALKERYPDTRTVGLLPIPRLSETTVKPLRSFENCSRIIREEYENLGIEVVDGTTLVPKDAALFADNLHPNADGFAVYAENLIPHLK